MKKAKLLTLTLLLFIFTGCQIPGKKKPIDRFALVTRHNVTVTTIDSLSPLTVGNGEFAYTVDITGMQSFPEYYEKGIPLGTQSQWGWHSFPNPENYSFDDVYKMYKSGKDSVPYLYQYFNHPDKRKNEATKWLRENPHRLHLGILGMEFLNDSSEPYLLSDIKNPVQTIDLWTGKITSRFEIENTPVEVTTLCHQDTDMVSLRINSGLLKKNKIRFFIHFSYPDHEKFSDGCNFNNPDKHTSLITEKSDNHAMFTRQLDNDQYFVQLQWEGNAGITEPEKHLFYIEPSLSEDVFELNCSFSKEKPVADLPGFNETEKNNHQRWKEFWESGAAVDFSQCTDPLAFELERRVVLSQYLTKIQCTGIYPAQETGLTYNSWHGKFHMEMHWWHAMHFILWNRAELIEKQMDYYFRIFDKAQQTAQLQGYLGIRWPKMTGPDGRESPSTIGPFLIWQQPHVIYLSEMLLKYHHNNDSILKKYSKLVFATADFMASYARWDSLTNTYNLGPPLIAAQERFIPENTVNTPFELAYWHWALQKAQSWRERMGLEKDADWQHVIDNLAKLPVKDSLYLFAENSSDSYKNPLYLTDHPIVLGILGFLPETGYVDKKILEKSFSEINKIWNWQTCWGWDFPLVAMNAALLNRPESAVDFLLAETQKNTYLANGHNFQDEQLTIYLPGNGGLLSAIALMCTMQNEDGTNGFPDNGKWNVTYDNLIPLHE